ncbi:hypothetical protein DF3PA_110069 [Candidatus Defluviicoccus seviourii]|uniref:Uncharacterized protein n=1 Tax=Candidatus Defluviicoccus seviourii TaxID=2565273 RepID=A0A564WA18_9PROT|nr:hypothetical protein DF3PA_110069 [Candidatus Defluviicoccus seviourii]
MQQNALVFGTVFGYDFFEAKSSSRIGAHHIEVGIAPSAIADADLCNPPCPRRPQPSAGLAPGVTANRTVTANAAAKP